MRVSDPEVTIAMRSSEAHRLCDALYAFLYGSANNKEPTPTHTKTLQRFYAHMTGVAEGD